MCSSRLEALTQHCVAQAVQAVEFWAHDQPPGQRTTQTATSMVSSTRVPPGTGVKWWWCSSCGTGHAIGGSRSGVAGRLRALGWSTAEERRATSSGSAAAARLQVLHVVTFDGEAQSRRRQLVEVLHLDGVEPDRVDRSSEHLRGRVTPLLHALGWRSSLPRRCSRHNSKLGVAKHKTVFEQSRRDRLLGSPEWSLAPSHQKAPAPPPLAAARSLAGAKPRRVLGQIRLAVLGRGPSR